MKRADDSDLEEFGLAFDPPRPGSSIATPEAARVEACLSRLGLPGVRAHEIEAVNFGKGTLRVRGHASVHAMPPGDKQDLAEALVAYLRHTGQVSAAERIARQLETT